MAVSLLILLALLVAVVWWRAGARTRSVEAMYPPIGRILDVDGVPVHALVRGDGPDLVLIHGASGNLREFLPLIARLQDRYRVIAFDRPGLGYTGRTDPAYADPFTLAAESPAEQARLLAAAARALGAERPLVLGHSYGGAVALAWALDEEAAGLIDVSGVAMPWPGGLGTLYRATDSRLGGAVVPALVAAAATRGQVAAAIESVFAPQPEPEGYVDEAGAALILSPGRFRANARQVNALRPHVVEMEPRYPSLHLPVEIVHGDADTIVPIGIHSIPLSQAIQGADLTVLDGMGHMPHRAAMDAVAAAVDRAAARAGLR
ncbi:alpha/beta fold hydrolase [Wenxinia marina]|uniref:alpha/beta fold hydrolase n=1 Tax=Wenxinia marina TaxID=390641 RepID=UPI00036B6742